METAIIDETTQRYLGQWQRLVSTTNWDKGRIICDWRQSLEESGAPVTEYSDETWSRQVGNVTPQHVGRLRRTWERFGAVAGDYAGLYWSHFQAASDWPDPEMWLEGAVQSDWSVQQMRQQRATALGLVEADSGSADATAPWDDDADAPTNPSAARETVVQDPSAGQNGHAAEYDAYESRHDSAGGDDDDDDGHDGPSADSRHHAGHDPATSGEVRRPFAELPSLPADVSEAFESFKLCILRHKLAGWAEVSATDVLAALDALKELALAPPVE